LTAFVVAVFALVYAGMAVGRFPGLSVDRTGFALLGAIGLYVGGAIDGPAALAAVDFPTLIVLFGLMVLSAQYDACGFYDWAAARVAGGAHAPARILAATVAVGGGLSAVLANDVVVFAMTPMLCRGLAGRGLDPRPFLIGLAGAANAGSAATVIGNPQNILIAETGGFGFWSFLAVAGPPALAGLVVVYLTVLLLWRGRFHLPPGGRPAVPQVVLDRPQLWKAVLATAALGVLFATPLPHVEGVLIVAGALLVSRRLATRRMLGLVDWHLLALFGGLFVVTHALAATGLPAEAVARLEAAGLLPDRLAVLAPLSLAASNTIGNVPAVMLILAVLPDLPEGAMVGLAVLTTLAGNLFLLGSIANLIVAERARAEGVALGFVLHARAGVPMTLASSAVACLWLWWAGALPW